MLIKKQTNKQKPFADVVFYYLDSYRQLLNNSGCLKFTAYSDLELCPRLPECWDLQVCILNTWAW